MNGHSRGCDADCCYKHEQQSFYCSCHGNHSFVRRLGVCMCFGGKPSCEFIMILSYAVFTKMQVCVFTLSLPCGNFVSASQLLIYVNSQIVVYVVWSGILLFLGKMLFFFIWLQIHFVLCIIRQGASSFLKEFLPSLAGRCMQSYCNQFII